MATDVRLKDRLPELTDHIVETYHEISTMHHLGHCPLPNLGGVVEIAQHMQELIFPGYRHRQNLHFGNVTYFVGDVIERLHDGLVDQISRALRHEHRRKHGLACSNIESQDFDAQAQQLALAFLETVPTLRRTLAQDVQAAYDGDPAAGSLDEIIFCYPGLEAITINRIAHELYRLKIPMIPRMLTEWAHSRTGIDIHPGATIGPRFFIDHGTGVVIGETCEIADSVKIYQGVTLGALSFAKDDEGNLVRGAKRHPTIESGVVIYANATVLGGETIVGAHSVIGAGVSLYESVRPHTIVTLERPSLRFRQAS